MTLPAASESVSDQENGWLHLPQSECVPLDGKLAVKLRNAPAFASMSAEDKSAIEQNLKQNEAWHEKFEHATSFPKFQKKPFSLNPEHVAISRAFMNHGGFLFRRIHFHLSKGGEQELLALAELRHWHDFLRKFEQGGLDFLGWVIWVDAHLRIQKALQSWISITKADNETILQTIAQISTPELPFAISSWRTTCANEHRNSSVRFARLADPGEPGEAAWLEAMAMEIATKEIMADFSEGLKPKKKRDQKNKDIPQKDRGDKIIRSKMEEWRDPNARPKELTEMLQARLEFDWAQFHKAWEDEHRFLANVVEVNRTPREITRLLKAHVETAKEFSGTESKLDQRLGLEGGKIQPPVRDADFLLRPWHLLQRSFTIGSIPMPLLQHQFLNSSPRLIFLWRL